MDIKTSTFYETLINDLIHLNKLNYLNLSKKEITINHCINKLKKIAILRYKLVGTTYLEKEIAYLDNIEDKFIENLRCLISFPKLIHPAQSDSFAYFFTGFTCFVSLTAYYWALCLLLSAPPLTLLAGALLTFFTFSAFIIFQVNAIRLLENESPVLSQLEEIALSIVKKSLKNIALELEQPISLMENKINYLENKNANLTLSYENEGCLAPPSSLIQTLSQLNINNFFKPSSENNNNILANTQTTKAYQSDLSRSFTN